MPRFAVLRHESPRGLHWDFLLESGGSLRTWSLPEPPENAADLPCNALPDHRTAYLDYEGPVSGGRGEVSRWDRGEFRAVEESDALLAVELRGDRLRGRMELRPEASASGRWRATFHAAE